MGVSRNEVLKDFCVYVDGNYDEFIEISAKHTNITDDWNGLSGCYGVRNGSVDYTASKQTSWGKVFASVQEFKEFLESGEKTAPPAEEIEAKRWYQHKTGPNLWFVTSIDKGFPNAYGFTGIGSWCEENYKDAFYIENFRLATDDVVLKNLTKKASEDYKKGCIYLNVFNGKEYEISGEGFDLINSGELVDKETRAVVFDERGKWATIVSQPEEDVSPAENTIKASGGVSKSDLNIGDTVLLTSGPIPCAWDEDKMNKYLGTEVVVGKMGGIDFEIDNGEGGTWFIQYEDIVKIVSHVNSPAKPEKKMVLAENTVVHCETEDLAKGVLKVAYGFGKKEMSCNRWSHNTSDTVYYLDEKKVSYSGIKYAKTEGYKIIPAEQFLKDNGEVVITGTGGEIDMIEAMAQREGVNEMFKGVAYPMYFPPHQRMAGVYDDPYMARALALKQEYPLTTGECSPANEIIIPIKKKKKRKLNLSSLEDVKIIKM